MKFKALINKIVQNRCGIALGMAVLMSAIAIFPYVREAVFASGGANSTGSSKRNYWKAGSGSIDYYGKDSRHYLFHLQFSDGKAAICLDAKKNLTSGKTGTIIETSYEKGNFPTGITRAGAEILGYALALAGGANGGEIKDPYWYCLCQCLCWMVEDKGGNVTWADLDDWVVRTKELGKHLDLDYTTFCNKVDDYKEQVTRRIRPEAVPSFMSKYPSEAPKLELHYNMDTGIWENDFELINNKEAADKGLDLVWMQYHLDYDKAPARVGLNGKLKLERNTEGSGDNTRNWLHVEYNGDIADLKAAGPIALQFEEGTDAYNYIPILDTISIWQPNDSSQQHLLENVTTSPWKVYMNFGGGWKPEPGSYEVIVNTYQHDETFVSNYNTDIYKYDFETGKPLQNAEFEILERMDTSQFNDSVNHHGGNAGGTYPLDDLNFDKFQKIRDNSVKPDDDWNVCGSYTTDENGLISHQDIFKYNFRATYCGGHEEPVIKYPAEPEIPKDEDGEEPDTFAHDAWEEDCRKLEAAAKAAWEKAVEECTARTNFHSINPGEAKAACEAYRDEVWNAFIHLDYQYTAREKTARTGYTLHDIHVDDNPIETVVFDSSEANNTGDYSTATGKFIGNIPNKNIDNKMLEETEAAVTFKKNEIPVVEYSYSNLQNSYKASKLEGFGNLSEEISEENSNDDELSNGTPSNAILSFETIGSEVADTPVPLFDYDLYCTWNGIDWKFDGDPEQPFLKSEITAINQDSYGHDHVAHVFRVYDHRTEGEIHINKRDLNLESSQDKNYFAYADANGDGTLEGAVYGLYAAEDIIHPDGKTGAIFSAGELVSIATTDRNGDASFLAITEKSKTSESKSNLYTQDITTQLINHGINIDERTYQNNQLNNGNEWIGRPLLLGRYYVRELSRSEGYELSVNGINNIMTNFGVSKDIKYESTGTARFNGYKPDDQYGDDQDRMLRFDIFYKNTEGYNITISGFPETTEFYREVEKTVTKTEEVVVGSHIEVTGKPIAAKGGEFVLDANGVKIPLLDASGNQVYDTVPKTGMFFPTLRNGKYPNGKAVVSDQTTYDSKNIDVKFIKKECQSFLKQMGYSVSSNKNAMPWRTITVSGSTNGEIIENLIKELRKDTFYDSYIIDKVTAQGNSCTFIIRFAYLYQNTKAYLNGNTLYIRNTCTNQLEDGSRTPGYYYIKYTPGQYEVKNGVYTIETKRLKNGVAVYGKGYDLVNEYDPLYKTYAAGEQKYGMMLQKDGSYKYGPLFETKEVIEKEIISYDVTEFELTKLKTVYKDGIYTIHIDTSDVDWTNKDAQTDAYRIIIPNGDKELIKQNSMVSPCPDLTEVEAGSYVRYKTLAYRSQHNVYSGVETRDNPVEVLERPIRQRVKVVKDIFTNINGAYDNDTYKDNHTDNSIDLAGRYDHANTDWLTSLSNNGITGQSLSRLPEFRFKAYLKSNLERLYRDENGRIVWLDRNGNALVPEYQDTDGDGNYETFVWKNRYGTTDFPETDKMDGNSLTSANVQKIFTKVKHNGKSTTIGDIPNNTWADYADPQAGNTKNVGEIRPYNTSLDGKNGEAIMSNGALYSYQGKNRDVARSDRLNKAPNKDYTRLLETRVEAIEDGAGKTRQMDVYNYEKFFDAIAAANMDKWDNDMFASEKNYPGQHWFDTFHERYQMDDADPDGTAGNTDGTDADGTGGGDKDTSFKPFQWIREYVFGSTEDAKSKYPAVHNNVNIENKTNTSDTARKNAEASDQVRQFAVDWYLFDEVAKLVKNNGNDENVATAGSLAYQEEVYDHALEQALIKAYYYLKPFYEYDLDTIYSVRWDSSANGGTDHDVTTLSADTLYQKAGAAGEEGQSKDGYYYGVSAYLPYGTYIVAEQQPYSAQLQDFDNKHYKVDKPKEVTLPAIYEEGKHAGVPETMNKEYTYHSAHTPEKLMEKYQIRFQEEWSDTHTEDLRNYVIRAHGYDGDYEIFKYGLDADRLTSRIDYSGGSYDYEGFTIAQDADDPLKNYYNNPLVNTEQDGGNKDSHYFADDKNKGVKTVNGSAYAADAIEKRYHYGSISEHAGVANDVLYQNGTVTDKNSPSGFYFKDNVKTMTGNQTAYEGRYAPMLVPWSVTEPIESDIYDITNFRGYADSKFRNTYYAAKLRIEKLDSETGEQILHDDAVFAIYAAARNGSKEGNGEALFYEKDTLITGSKEFLDAMGVENITPTKKGAGGDYSGIVKEGTPICFEEDQVILSDALGNKTGKFRVYSTNQDELVLSENQENKEYANQNTGYLVTPEPLGAGVYVLAELKPPAGYLRTAPIAIEIYSDQVSYYMNGDKNNKVIATIYENRSK